MNPTSAEKEKVRDLLKDFSTAMLVTHDGGGTLRARPMAIADLSESCDLWFITNRESAKVHEIESDTHIHVVCQRDRSAYLSISGKASLVHDPERIAAVWKEAFRVWFPDGQEDPHLVLIHLTPDRAEYWDNQGLNKASYLWESAIAYVSGESPKVKEGEVHGVVRLR